MVKTKEFTTLLLPVNGGVLFAVMKNLKGEKLMPGKQASCPECGYSIDVFKLENYEIIDCPDCNTSLEYVKENNELIYNW